MPSLERTRALIADLAQALGLPDLPPDNSGGVQVTIGEDTDVFLYGGDDVTVLIVAPVAALPREAEYGLTLYLLRANMFDAPTHPFRIAADEAGALVFWARLPIAEFDGASLAVLLGRVAEQVTAIRAEVEGPQDAG